MTMPLYNQLIQHGYRRSGTQTYCPHCNNCKACIACRVCVNRFQPNRNQRRCLRNNQDLSKQITHASFTEEYFQLYQKYLNSRHRESNMANPTTDDFRHFLYCDWSDTLFIELRKNQTLIAVAVCDITLTGLSAVYTFFDPDESKRSPGTLCILLQIQHTQIMQLDYLYMGYWIDNCQKMQYKTNFKPMEFYIDNIWKEGASAENSTITATNEKTTHG